MHRGRRHAGIIAAVTEREREPEPEPDGRGPHLRAYLGVRLERSSSDVGRGALLISQRCRTRAGNLSLGAVATMTDVAALRRANEVHPSPLVTSHLSLRIPGPLDDGLFYADSTVVRAGRARVISAVRVTDERDRVVGLGSVSSDALMGQGTSHQRARGPEEDDDFYVGRAGSAPDNGVPIDDFLALEPGGEGEGRVLFRMPFHEILRNVNGVLHGGAATLLIEQAARQVATAADPGTETVVDAIEVHFLAPGLTGPFLASVKPLSGRASIVAEVEASDLGNGGRPVALGFVSLRRGGG